ncbi:hypothetical protein GCM10010172_84960 [Paractinoplanes ferrugineus]|uniref:Uncharacterized protein n=1 Tax=Paractinoplanes ferrugineus TaxID=113564 RepID=A0A919J684_9ACTN|nr:hypothetical protein Afe05nite_70750 [Actinoplanes ferrugineus]
MPTGPDTPTGRKPVARTGMRTGRAAAERGTGAGAVVGMLVMTTVCRRTPIGAG